MSNFARYYWKLRAGFRAVFQQNAARDGDGNLTPAAADCLGELKDFCRADKSCIQFGKDGRVDPILSAAIEGRREVWLKIVQTLNLSDEEIMRLRAPTP